MTALQQMILRWVWACMVFPSCVLAAPQIACTQPERDFGEVEREAVVDGVFTITNDGNQPLHINRIVPGCGCGHVTISKTTISPGGQAVVKAALSAGSDVGWFRREIVIESDDPERQRYSVFMAGTSVELLSLKPARGVFFGPVVAGSSEERSIELRTMNPDVLFQIAGLGVEDDSQLIARCEEVEKEKAYRVYVRLAAQVTQGLLRGSVRVRTNNPKLGTITLPVTAIVTEALGVAPSEITLNPLTDQPGVTRSVVVAPAKIKSFRVVEVVPPVPSVTVTVVRGREGAYRMTVQGLKPTKDMHGTVLLIKTDIPETAEIRIPIHVMGMASVSATSRPTGFPTVDD